MAKKAQNRTKRRKKAEKVKQAVHTAKPAFFERVEKGIKRHKLAVALAAGIGAAGMMGVHKEVPYWLGRPRYEVQFAFLTHAGRNVEHLEKEINASKRRGKKYDLAVLEQVAMPEQRGFFEKRTKELQSTYENSARGLKKDFGLNENDAKELAYTFLKQVCNLRYFGAVNLKELKEVSSKLGIDVEGQRRLLNQVVLKGRQSAPRTENVPLIEGFAFQTMLLLVHSGTPAAVVEEFTPLQSRKFMKMVKKEKSVFKKILSKIETANLDELFELDWLYWKNLIDQNKLRHQIIKTNLEKLLRKKRKQTGKSSLNTLVIYGRLHSEIAEMLPKDFSVKTSSFENLSFYPNKMTQTYFEVRDLSEKTKLNTQRYFLEDSILKNRLASLKRSGRKKAAGEIRRKVRKLSKNQINRIVAMTRSMRKPAKVRVILGFFEKIK